MKQANFAVLMAVVLAVLLAGCISGPEKGTSNQSAVKVPVTEPQGNIRYVQLNLLDGTSVGGIYVSETPAFTTIQYMYKLEPGTVGVTTEAGGETHMDYPKITNESGATVGFKNSLINTMIDIKDPALVIENAQQERKKAEYADKIGREKMGWPPKPLGTY